MDNGVRGMVIKIMQDICRINAGYDNNKKPDMRQFLLAINMCWTRIQEGIIKMPTYFNNKNT